MKKKMFVGKTIWITGASSGIGEALAVAFSQSGADVVLSARDQGGLERVAAKCHEHNPVGRQMVEAFDVSDHQRFPSVVKHVLERSGGIDILVSNAGVGQRGTALSSSPDVLRNILNVNFFGSVFLTRELLPSMLQRGNGRVVVISSILGTAHLPGRSGYCASKHALHGYFNTLRSELQGSGVEVSIISPGIIATDISRHALTEEGTPYGKPTPSVAGRMRPETCAKRIVRAVADGKLNVSVGGVEVWSGTLSALFPKLYEKIIRKRSKEFLAYL